MRKLEINITKPIGDCLIRPWISGHGTHLPHRLPIPLMVKHSSNNMAAEAATVNEECLVACFHFRPLARNVWTRSRSSSCLIERDLHKGYIAEQSCVPPIGASHDYRQPTSP